MVMKVMIMMTFYQLSNKLKILRIFPGRITKTSCFARCSMEIKDLEVVYDQGVPSPLLG